MILFYGQKIKDVSFSIFMNKHFKGWTYQSNTSNSQTYYYTNKICKFALFVLYYKTPNSEPKLIGCSNFNNYPIKKIIQDAINKKELKLIIE